jgi:hypothetical protein
VIVVALLAAPLPALAALELRIQRLDLVSGDYSGSGQTVIDNGSTDLDPVIGSIFAKPGSAGLPAMPGMVATTSFDIGISNSPGTAPFSLLDLNWGATSTSTSGTRELQLTVSDTGFTFPPSGKNSTLTSSISGNITVAGGDNAVTAQQWVDLTNTLFGLGTVTPGLQGPFTAASFSNSKAAYFASTTPYSITDRLNLTLGPSAIIGGDLQSTVVPEPVTMFLGGTGLLMLTYAARRRLFGK